MRHPYSKNLPMLEIWFIRHGESAANAGLATEHPETIPLTELGQAQAAKVGAAFERAPGLIITSSYLRARQTAEHTQRRFPHAPVETWDVHEFTYLSPLVLGMSSTAERKPIVKAYWEKCDPEHVHGPGAESFAGFIKRVQAARAKLLNTDHSFIAVFGHGFVMKAMLLLNLVGEVETTPEVMRRYHLFHQAFDVPNCAIIKAEFQPDKLFMSGLITSHLK